VADFGRNASIMRLHIPLKRAGGPALRLLTFAEAVRQTLPARSHRRGGCHPVTKAAGRPWGVRSGRSEAEALGGQSPTLREALPLTSGARLGVGVANGTPLERGQYEHGEPSSPKPPQAREVAAVLCLVDSTNRFARPRIADKDLFARGATWRAETHGSGRKREPEKARVFFLVSFGVRH
jgi:hypothetical protein